MSLLPGRFYLDDFFDDFDSSKKIPTMSCDIYEKDDKCNIVLDIPGFKKEDIKINVENGYLTVTAESKNETEEKDKKYIKRERFYGSVKREFYIGEVDPESIEASFNDGILHIEVPKELDKKSTKQIEIK